MVELKRQIAVGVVMAIIAVVVVIAFSVSYFPRSGVQSTTLHCNTPGVVCGGLTLSSANLTASDIGNHTWVLDLALNVTGSTAVNSIQVYLGNVSVDSRQGPFPVGTTLISLQITDDGIVAGQMYSVQVEGFYVKDSYTYANVWTQFPPPQVEAK